MAGNNVLILVRLINSEPRRWYRGMKVNQKDLKSAWEYERRWWVGIFYEKLT